MLKEISIEEGIAMAGQVALVDVRSPGEYKKGHIPGAINIPLFSNEERAKVGTMYVQQSKEKAIDLAYSLVNPKRQYFIDKATEAAIDGKLIVHCWRGGMRSRSLAEHIEANGIKEVYIIKRGYKAFRKNVLSAFEKRYSLFILGGYTGSGKTEILKQMKLLREQMIDLEEIAHHKGSVFGGMGKKIELTTEQFENDLYWQWRCLDFSKPIWLEDESANIGPVNIPPALYHKMREAPVIFLNIPKEKRANFLVIDYESCSNEVLINNVQKIAKRLGGQNVKAAIMHIEQGNYFEAAMILLNYYDKYYLKGLLKRSPGKIYRLEAEDINHPKNAQLVIERMLNEIK